ncbi:hypothetical protein [Oleidesulfovibrio sp.]|uniref:hypothetical protein n=1 Tax=Oleidesulfovibrio sp. TaxID=2909707 RepID=UPI003A84C356
MPRLLTLFGKVVLVAVLTWGCVSAGQSYSNRIAKLAKGDHGYQVRGEVTFEPVRQTM